MPNLAEDLANQRDDIRNEARLQRQSIETRWRQPLWSRVQSSRALGPLTLREIDPNELLRDHTRQLYMAFTRAAQRLVILCQHHRTEHFLSALLTP